MTRLRNVALGLALAPVCLLTMTGVWAVLVLGSLVDQGRKR